MKIVKIMQIFLMVFLVGSMIVSAAVDSSYECEDDNCMEGTEIRFTVNIVNNINKTIIVKDVYARDKDYGTVIAYDLSEDITLNPDEFHQFNFTSLVKAPKVGYTFYYVPCFTVSYEENPSEESEICGKTVKSFTVIPLEKIECRTDDECAEDEYCNTFSLYKCKKLECKEGEKIVNHKCVEILPQQITVINWWNVFVLLLIIIVALFLLIILFGRKEQEDEIEDDFDIDLSDEEEEKKKQKKSEGKERQKKEDSKEKEIGKEKVEEESKKTEKKNRAEKEFREEDEVIEEDKENMPKEKIKTKKKYKRVKKAIGPIIDQEGYDSSDEKDADAKKKSTSESPYDDETNEGVVDYDGYEDEDDDENRDPFV